MSGEPTAERIAAMADELARTWVENMVAPTSTMLDRFRADVAARFDCQPEDVQVEVDGPNIVARVTPPVETVLLELKRVDADPTIPKACMDDTCLEHCAGSCRRCP